MRYKEIPTVSEIERFLSRISVNQESGCWEWMARIDIGGYGKFHIKDSFYMAHRISYTIFNKQVPLDLVIDHVCRNRRCCNPDHLRVTTHKDNTLTNSMSTSAINKTKTHCKRGHEFSIENTAYDDIRRICKACRKINNDNRYKYKARNALKQVEELK